MIKTTLKNWVSKGWHTKTPNLFLPGGLKPPSLKRNSLCLQASFSFTVSKIIKNHQPKAPQSWISINKQAHVDKDTHIYPDNSDLSGSNANFSLYSRFRPESETDSNCGTSPLLYASSMTLLWHVWMEGTAMWHFQTKQTVLSKKVQIIMPFFKPITLHGLKYSVQTNCGCIFVDVIIIGGSGQFEVSKWYAVFLNSKIISKVTVMPKP